MIMLEQLTACIGLAQRTRAMRERIERIRALAELANIKSDMISGEGKRITDGTGEGGSMLADLLSVFEQQAQAYFAVAWEVERVVKTAPLTDTQRDTIRYRYIDGMTWPEIADALNYSERQCYRIEEEAIKILTDNKKHNKAV